MASRTELLEVVNFFSRHANVGMFSTSATPVEVHDDVYNVSGSTWDPKIGGKSWKKLLMSEGINDDCYVTNQNPPLGTSHPDFSVGGHVTTNADGIVNEGEESYLMPLCYWHNSTQRDGRVFSHASTTMLRLDGFMQGDTGTTFMARLSDGTDGPARIIFETDDGWDFKKLGREERLFIQQHKMFQLFEEGKSTRFFVISKNEADGKFYLDFASSDFSNLL